MAVGASNGSNAIRIEPMSSAVGLWVGGVDLLSLDSGLADMIGDMWQLGGALLFRQQDDPVMAAAKLAGVLAKGPVAGPGANDVTGDGVRITGEWTMPGAGFATPPNLLVFGCENTLPPLAMAGMEAAADALRMEDPDFLAEITNARAAHVAGGPVHPVLHRHPLSGEACLYPPPAGLAGFAGGERLLSHVERPAFCWTHEWQPGDVLAVDPRAVRSRWAGGQGHPGAMIVVPGLVPLAEGHGLADDRE